MHEILFTRPVKTIKFGFHQRNLHPIVFMSEPSFAFRISSGEVNFLNFLFTYSKLRCLAAKLLNTQATQLQVAAHNNHQDRSVHQSLNIFRSAQPAPNHTNQRRENRSAAAYTRRELPAKQPAMTGIRV